MVLRILLTIGAVVWWCVSAQAAAGLPLSIHLAEREGFQRMYQPFYQIVGAVDAWRGEWAGEEVEIYQFDSGPDMDVEVFEAMVLPGNSSGWKALCKGKNLLMLSKGEAACERLKVLAENY